MAPVPPWPAARGDPCAPLRSSQARRARLVMGLRPTLAPPAREPLRPAPLLAGAPCAPCDGTPPDPGSSLAGTVDTPGGSGIRTIEYAVRAAFQPYTGPF